MFNPVLHRTFRVIGFFLLVGVLVSSVPSLVGQTGIAGKLSALAADDSASSSYLPFIQNGFPLATVFGTESKSIDGQGGLYKMMETEVYWWRLNGVLWSDVEATKGFYDWTALADLEGDLANAARNGIQVILIVRGTPDWAQAIPGVPCGPIEESEFGSFANFVKELVSRYSQPPYSVKHWEIWNEPDIDHTLLPEPELNPYGCWGDKNDEYYGGGYYAEMLKNVYPAVKEADPDSQILVGGLLLDCDPINPPPGKNCKSSKFLEGILNSSGGDYFDGISFHAYEYYLLELGAYSNANWDSAWNTTGPVLIAKTQFINNLLEDYGISGKFLMNTESALLCDVCVDDPNFETTKGHYLAQAFASAINLDLEANIWYSVFGYRNSQLLEPDGTPLPAYDAFKFAQDELQDSEFVQEISIDDKVKIYEFDRGDRRVWVMWSMKSVPTSVDLPGLPQAVYDALGNPITPSDPFAINWKTHYLEWLP